MDCSPSGSSIHGISQANILEWVAISFSGGSSQPGDRTHIPWIDRQIIYHGGTREALTVHYILVIWVSSDTIVKGCAVCAVSEGSSWSNREMTPWSEVKWSGVAQSCPTLCNPMDCSPAGSSVHGISQARILAWTAISYSRGLPDPRIEPASPALTGRFFNIALPGSPCTEQVIDKYSSH